MYNKIRLAFLALLSFVLSFSFTACGKTTQEIEQKIIMLDSKSVYNAYRVGDDITMGAKVTFSPTIMFASKKKIGYITFKRWEGYGTSNPQTHYMDFDFSIQQPSEKEIYNGFYVYEMQIPNKIFSCESCKKNGMIFVNNAVLTIDGVDYVYHMQYNIDFYENETPFIAYNTLISSEKRGDYYLEFTANESVELVNIEGFRNATYLINGDDAWFMDLPKTMNKGDVYTKTVSWATRTDYVKGSDYFIIHYKKSGDDTIYRAPIGFLQIEPSADYWKAMIDNAA